MTKLQIDSYKMKESNVETIDEDGELIRIDLVLEENKDPVVLDGVITGKVTDDIGVPLIGATVTLKYASNSSIFKEVKTDSNARYIIYSVPPKIEFKISASQIGYIPKTLSNSIILNPLDEVNQDIKLTSILGILFGVLLDIYRKPIIGVLLLYLYPPLTPGAPPVFIGTTDTGKDGKFSFPDIPVGKYQLVAQTDIYKDVSTTFDYLDPDNATEIELEFEEEKLSAITGKITDTRNTALSGAIVTLKTFPEYLVVTKVFTNLFGNYSIDNVVPHKSFVVSAIAMQYTESTSGAILTLPGFTNTQNLTLNDLLGSIIGKLLDDTSNPISGTLYLYVSSNIVPFKTTTANSNGDFNFTGIPRGSYKIIASNSKYKDVSTSFSYDDANFPLSVTIKFIEKLKATISGKITNTKNIAISSAIVTLKTSPDLLVVTKVFSDSSGNYSIIDIIPDKSYLVTAIANQYVESSSSVLTLTPASTVTQNLSLNDLLGSILGTLLDSSSNSVSGSLYLYDSTVTNLIKSTTSDSNGFFVFNNTPRGNYVILAKSPKYLDISTTVNYADANFPLNVIIKFAEKVKATITGKITDSKNAAISGATVTLKNSSDLSVVTTVSSDASGNYSITNVIPDKSYIVSAIANQYVSSTSGVLTPTPASTVTQNLSLSNLFGSITGTLLDYALVTISGSLFLYDSLGTTLLKSTSSDSNGLFAFDNVSANNYILLAQATKYKDVSKSVSYTDANAPLNVELKFAEKKTAQVKGVVLDKNNIAINSASVSLKNQYTSSITSTTTDSTGNYLFNNVPIDTIYTVSADSKQYISNTSTPLNIALPTIYTANFKLDDLLGSITGILLDTSSNPISASLSLYSDISSLSTISSLASTLIKTITSGSDGKFNFSSVSRGSYTILAQSPLFKDLSTSFSYTDATVPLNLNIKFTQNNFVNISGKVTNTQNQGIQGATVTVKTSPNLVELGKASTDSSGNYSINNISLVNSFIIYASKDLYTQKNSNAFTSVNGTTITQNFTLSTPSGTISGKVVDASNSNPVQNALVLLYSIDANTNFASTYMQTNTDLAGVYTFLNVSINQPGSEYYRTKSVALGYDNTESSRFTYSDITIPFIVNDIRTPLSGGAIKCLIKDSSGNIIKNATATLRYHPSLEVVMTTTYDNLVDYAFGPLYPPHDYIITAVAPGYVDGMSAVINMKFGDVYIIEYIILTVLGSISGKILNPSSIGLANATVSLHYYSNSAQITSMTTDYYANYYFGSLDPNDYFVKAVLPGYATNSTGKITVVNGVTNTNYNITLTGSGSISGKVWDKNWYGITNVIVSLYYSSNSNLVKTTTTDGSAYYNLGSLEPNNYFVKASLSGYNDNYSGNITVNASNTTYNMTLIKSEYAPLFDTLVISTPITYSPLKYSATWGELYNGAVLSYNNTFVDYLGGFNGGHFYIYITAPFYAKYDITVTYLAGDWARQLKVKVINGEPLYDYIQAIVPKTNGWQPYDALNATIGGVILKQGVNKLLFYNDTASYAPALSNLYFSYSQYAKVASVPNGSLFNGANNQWVEYWGNYRRYTVGIGGPNGGYVLMDYNFDIGGRYDIYFNYLSSGGDRPLSVQVNGSTNTYWFPATASAWLPDAKMYGITFYVPQGINTFKFFVDGSQYAPALSYAEVYFVPYLRTIYPYQFTLTGSAYIENGLVAGISSASGTMSIDVWVDAPGYYDLTFKYLDPNSGRKIRIKINGVSTGQTYDLPPTVDWNIVKLFTVKLYLDKWTNNILIYL